MNTVDTQNLSSTQPIPHAIPMGYREELDAFPLCQVAELYCFGKFGRSLLSLSDDNLYAGGDYMQGISPEYTAHKSRKAQKRIPRLSGQEQ
jgi:hypothetical protein